MVPPGPTAPCSPRPRRRRRPRSSPARYGRWPTTSSASRSWLASVASEGVASLPAGKITSDGPHHGSVEGSGTARRLRSVPPRLGPRRVGRPLGPGWAPRATTAVLGARENRHEITAIGRSHRQARMLFPRRLATVSYTASTFSRGVSGWTLWLGARMYPPPRPTSSIRRLTSASIATGVAR